MPPWSGTPSWSGPASWSCAGLRTTASWSVQAGARTGGVFWVFTIAVFSADGELLEAVYSLGGEGWLLRVWHVQRRELLGSLPSRHELSMHSSPMDAGSLF